MRTIFESKEAFIALLVAALLLGMYVAGPLSEPVCPTEDSCFIDYDNGHWYIYEVTR